LVAKFRVPLVRPEVVHRPRLLERLCGGLVSGGAFTRRLSLISAPAGFGKTTLAWQVVQHCLEAEPRLGIAWLALDEDDRHLQAFIPHLKTALCLPSTEGTPLEDGDAAMTILLNELAELEAPTLVVLDDYQFAESGEVDQTMAFLLEHLPPCLHMVITTRALPDLPLPRFRTRGQLGELDAADLRFDVAEASDFLLRCMGLEIKAHEVAALEARTEGWVAGLQLAALSLRGRQDAGDFISGFAGSHRYVLDYLVDEVLLREAPDIRDFLLQTSILRELCVPLCDAVTGGRSRGMLDALERGNLFLVPLDDCREWYRYHALFAEALSARLGVEHPGEKAELHRRAGAWHEARGNSDEAIHHAFEAGDLEGAARLIELCWHTMDTSYRSATWLGWAQRLPDSFVRSRPVLSAGLGWALLDTGSLEASEEWFLNAENPPPDFLVSDEVQYRSMAASIAAGRAYRALALGDVATTVAAARRALDLAPADDHIRQLIGSSLLGLALYTEGDLAAAKTVMCASMSQMLASGRYSDAAGMTFLIADIRTVLGQLHEAERTYRESFSLVQGGKAIQPAVLADLHRGLGELLLERGELDAAGEEFRKGRELGEGLFLADWRYRIALAEARLAEATGDFNGALALLEEAERFHVRTPLPDARPLGALRARIWTRQGAAAKALAWASGADLAASDRPAYLTESGHLSLARALLARHAEDLSPATIAAAIDLLARLLEAAEDAGRMGSAIEVLTLLALSKEAGGDHSGAQAALERALALAEPEGFRQVFLGEGRPMQELLKRLEARLASGPVKSYAASLLALFAGKEAPRQAPCGAATRLRPPLEPLSGRELEVLKLLKTDLSGPEVARELYISLNTLRTHTKNIYDKLEVNSRRAAVSRAALLGLC
jgi:LuxR family maltose regulon positive regulatory protein